MALGDGFGQLIRPTGVTPIASSPVVVGNPLAETLGNLASEVERRVKPVVVDQAAQAGLQDGAAGVSQDRVPITDMDVAYMRANRAAYIARVETDRDATLEDLALNHQFDPQTFEAKAREEQAKTISQADPKFAVDIEMGWERGIARRAVALQRNKVRVDLARAKDDIDARLGTLKGTIETNARNGTLASDEAQEALESFNRLVDEKAANPAWGYSTQEAARDRVIMAGRVGALSAGRLVGNAFEESLNGGDIVEVAKAKARKTLYEEFDKNPALTGMGEAERNRLLAIADNDLTERATLAREEKRAIDEQEKLQSDAIKDKQRTNFDNLHIAAESGGLSNDVIGGYEARGDISPEQGRALRARNEREIRQEQSDQRREESARRADEHRARAEASRAEADRRRASAEERRASADAARDLTRAERERTKETREAGRDMVYDLRDLADTDPDAALTQARRLLGNGAITRAQFETVKSSVQSELQSDDRERMAEVRTHMKSLGAKSEDIEYAERLYRRDLDAGKFETAAQRDNWVSTFKQNYGRTAAGRASPTGSSRTLAQVNGELEAARRNRAMPVAQKAAMIDRLTRERRALISAR
jgi:hypothetical protein